MFLGRDLEEINDHTSAYDVNKIITNAFENADTVSLMYQIKLYFFRVLQSVRVLVHFQNGDGYLSFYELRDWIKKKVLM